MNHEPAAGGVPYLPPDRDRKPAEETDTDGRARQRMPVADRHAHRADDDHGDPEEHEDVGEGERDAALTALQYERVRDDVTVTDRPEQVAERAARLQATAELGAGARSR